MGPLPDVSSYFKQATDTLAGLVRDAREMQDRLGPPSTPEELLAASKAAAGRAMDWASDEVTKPGPVHDTVQVLKQVVGYFTSDDSKGTSIGVDEYDAPYTFNYGKTKDTLLHGELELTHGGTMTEPDPGYTGGSELWELGVKGRLFGSASVETLSASFGGEYEMGAKVSADEHGTTADGQHTEASGDMFLGHRGRAYIEGGILGATVGAESFIGMSQNADESVGDVGTASRWYAQSLEWSVGLSASASVHAGVTGFKAAMHEELGMRLRGEQEEHLPVAFGTGVLLKQQATFFIGAELDLVAKVNPFGAKAGVDAFVGAKATWRPEIGVTWQGHEIAGLFGELEGRVGLGVTAEAEYGWDWDTKTFSAKGEAGAAVGIGAAVGGGVTIGGIDFDKTFKKRHDL